MSARLHQIPKYAIIESERRFLVSPERMPDVSGHPFRHVTDLYITGTRLRLRQVTSQDGRDPVYKLCKKYEPLSPVQTPITNLYLARAEFEKLAAMDGSRLSKRRYSVSEHSRAFAFDLFESALEGLILAEAEVTSDETIPLPAWAVREVSGDPFFQGGSLATTTASQLAVKLADTE